MIGYPKKEIVGSMKYANPKYYKHCEAAVIAAINQKQREEHEERKQMNFKKRSLEMQYFVRFLHIKMKDFPEVIADLQEKLFSQWSLMADTYSKEVACAVTQIQEYVKLRYPDNEKLLKLTEELYAENGKRFHQWMELCLLYEEMKSKQSIN